MTMCMACGESTDDCRCPGRAAARLYVLEDLCKLWNDANPVGCEVSVKLDSGEVRQTRTRSLAQVLSGHSAVIWLEGIAGCYLLDRVRRR